MEERLKILIDICLSDQATPADRQELFDLISQSENRTAAKGMLLNAYHKNQHTKKLDTASRDTILNTIYQSTALSNPIEKPLLTRRLLARIAMAASVLILMTLGIYLYIHHHSTQDLMVNLDEFEPGSNKAVLTLADGRTIILDQNQEGIVIGSIIRYADGGGVVHEEEWRTDSNNSQDNFMTIHTPNGGQYAITLPDGSKVWMNAASTLKYPRRFQGTQRLVALEGEAYFEIAHRQDMPFVVKTMDQTVEVLGTHFNINSYADDLETRTTLVEGKVKVASMHSGASQILAPGEQSVLQNQSLRKQNVNLNTAIAWRQGRFDFSGKDLEQVMRELGRWYNIEVVYEGLIPEIEFWGGVYRNQNLETVLQILETNDLAYRLDGARRLVIFSRAK